MSTRHEDKADAEGQKVVCPKELTTHLLLLYVDDIGN